MSKTVKLSILYTLILVLVALLITGFCVKTTYRPEVKAPYTISIKRVDGQAEYDGGDIKNNKERYNSLYNDYLKGTEQSFMSSLFSGRMFQKSRISLYSEKTLSFGTGYQMTFIFPEEQTIMLNGQEFKHSTSSQTSLKFTKVHYNLTKTDGFKQVSAYYEVDSVSQSGTHTTVFYEQKFIANYDYLYNNITNKLK